MENSRFIRALVGYPWFILGGIFIFSSLCLILPLTIYKLPDFSDPQVGFEARGTPLAQKLTAWANIVKESRPGGSLISNPVDYYYFVHNIEKRHKDAKNVTTKVKRSKHDKKSGKRRHVRMIDEHQTKEKENDTSLEISELLIPLPKDFWEFPKDFPAATFFCNEPNYGYARVVISSKNESQNLWSVEGMIAQCYIDAILRASPSYMKICQRQLRQRRSCCPSWSPAAYMSLLSKTHSCLAVTTQELERVEKLLLECYPYFKRHELTEDCDSKCRSRVPPQCQNDENAFYYMMNHMMDVSFFKETENNSTRMLRSAMLMIPVPKRQVSLTFYHDIIRHNLKYKDFEVTAIQFGLKNKLFNRLIVQDSLFLLLGCAFVTLCIWYYTGSFLITLSTVLVVIFSLGISYAIYTMIFRIKLFPFMNLLAVVVALGIGSDDTFIFCKVWDSTKRQRSLNVEQNLLAVMNETMRHAVPTMFVSTVTTAVAFFASTVSNVTAINCFSLFSGMTVIVNFLLMITWLPASVVVAERAPKIKITLWSIHEFLMRNIVMPVKVIVHFLEHQITTLLVNTVIGMKWLFFLTLLAAGIIGCIIVFRHPGLQFPDTQNFQLLDDLHLFEQYDTVYKHRFPFESQGYIGDVGSTMPLRFVWGVLPVDNGEYYDPNSYGTLVMDKTFNVSTPEAQLWLQNFCEDLRTQPFYQSTMGPLLTNCFIESIQPWMRRPCEDPIDPTVNYAPCCEISQFPYEPHVLKKCAAIAMGEIQKTPTFFWWSGTDLETAGIKYVKPNETVLRELAESKNMSLSLEEIMSEIAVIIVEYDSTYKYSLSFSEMNEFYEKVEAWMKTQLLTAPEGMKKGWFISRFEFFELQRTLYEGTIWAIVVSMGLALTVLALVTLNPYVSVFAILTVGSAIVVTVAILVVMGWKLNVLESIAVSTAIGLAVDFSLHYSVSYRASDADGRKERVRATLEQMGGPTLMAALTTGIAGALMLPSRVLAYIQIGIFLLIIMAVSWVYATFFLCSMLAIAGPSSNFGQFRYPQWRRMGTRRTSDDEDTVDEVEMQEIGTRENLNTNEMPSNAGTCPTQPDCQAPHASSDASVDVNVDNAKNNERSIDEIETDKVN